MNGHFLFKNKNKLTKPNTKISSVKEFSVFLKSKQYKKEKKIRNLKTGESPAYPIKGYKNVYVFKLWPCWVSEAGMLDFLFLNIETKISNDEYFTQFRRSVNIQYPHKRNTIFIDI